MSRHSTWYAVEVSRPSATRFKFVACSVQGSVAGGASVDASFGHVLVIFASEWRFSAFFAYDAELFYKKCKFNIYVDGDKNVAG